MRKKIKHMFWKHWNCLPWLLCGISVLIEGEVEMYQYILVLFVLLMLIWVKLPLDKGDIFIIQKKTEAALADGRETVCGEVERGKGE